MALSDTYPELYAEWVAAGGITNNFRANVLALAPSGYTVTSDDVAFLVNQCNGAFNQLNLALGHYNGVAPAVVTKAVLVTQQTS